MECLSTCQADHTIVKAFFQDEWPYDLSEEAVWEHGYLVSEDEATYAFFMLQPVEENVFWLKNFYIKQAMAPTYVLALIEVCIKVARDKGAKRVYVHSQQAAMNELVEQLSFRLVETPTFNQGLTGEWWMLPVDK